MDIPLLSYPGINDNQRDGRLGKIMHGTGKWMMRAAIQKIHKHYLPVIEKKRAEGWHKAHVKALDEYWQRIILIFDQPINKTFGGFSGKDDPNREIFVAINDIFLCMMDEDTFYELPVLFYLKEIHEHWDLFEPQAAQAYGLMNFGNVYKEFLAQTEPLPTDDGREMEDELDALALEQTALEGKTWDGQRWVMPK